MPLVIQFDADHWAMPRFICDRCGRKVELEHGVVAFAADTVDHPGTQYVLYTACSDECFGKLEAQHGRLETIELGPFLVFLGDNSGLSMA